MSKGIESTTKEMIARIGALGAESVQEKAAMNRVIAHLDTLKRQIALPIDQTNRDILIERAFGSILSSLGDANGSVAVLSYTPARAALGAPIPVIMNALTAGASDTGEYKRFVDIEKTLSDKINSTVAGSIPSEINRMNAAMAALTGG